LARVLARAGAGLGAGWRAGVLPRRHEGHEVWEWVWGVGVGVGVGVGGGWWVVGGGWGFRWRWVGGIVVGLCDGWGWTLGLFLGGSWKAFGSRVVGWNLF
jgi:hypothetical protein